MIFWWNSTFNLQKRWLDYLRNSIKNENSHTNYNDVFTESEKSRKLLWHIQQSVSYPNAVIARLGLLFNRQADHMTKSWWFEFADWLGLSIFQHTLSSLYLFLFIYIHSFAGFILVHSDKTFKRVVWLCIERLGQIISNILRWKHVVEL